MFEPVLSLPQNPREAKLIADNLDALARALHDWSEADWQRVAVEHESAEESGMFGRLIKRTAPVAGDPAQRRRAQASAEAAASVLRVLWPGHSASSRAGETSDSALQPA
ncbi:MAG: hypothetical protein JO352_09330 [Chloroflexi bacterium]|nr:hypothetical protein [Chloroflexota bacterium]